jgi:predicted nucleotidyltransferase component of viral defense system
MQIFKQELLKEARSKGYKPEILEKVYRLLDIFKQLLTIEYLKDRLALKGGTALNLFYFDKLPRLSVDIDLNYIGHIDRAKMLEDKIIIVDAVYKVLLQNQFELYRAPMQYAGGKMVWFYNSVLGQRGTLEIDINFMYRQPLYPLANQVSKIEKYNDWQAPILDIHELAAGKLSALFNRNASRDLFDAHYLLTKTSLNYQKLREVLIPYLSMSKVELTRLTPQGITYDLTDLKNRLLPVMHEQGFPRSIPMLKQWATTMLIELQAGLAKILPLNDSESEFISKIRNKGIIQPDLITNDLELRNRIKTHPAILWATKQTHV